MLVAGAVIVLVNQSVPGPPSSTDYDPPAEVVAALRIIFPDDDCVTATEAGAAIQSALADVRDDTWKVTWAQFVKANECVGWDIGSPGVITLVPSMDPVVRTALEAFREKTFEDCLSEAQITEQITARLNALGAQGFEVRPGGAVGGPIDRIDAIVEHVQAGCFIYSTSGFADDGTRVYWIAGPQ